MEEFVSRLPRPLMVRRYAWSSISFGDAVEPGLEETELWCFSICPRHGFAPIRAQTGNRGEIPGDGRAGPANSRLVD